MTNLEKNMVDRASAKHSCPVLVELSNDLHSAKQIVPEYRGPPLVMAKRYIRSHNSAKENGTTEKKFAGEGHQTSPNHRIPCKPRHSKRKRRDCEGVRCTKEYPTSTTIDYGNKIDRDARSKYRKKTRSLNDLYASTSEIIGVDKN